jgi:ferredoxin
MKIRLDPELCQGHGRCYALASAVFDADDYGHCVLLVEEVAQDHERAARDAVENCPEQALSIED